MNTRILTAALAALAALGLAVTPATAQTLYVSNINSGIEKLSPNGTPSAFASDPGSGTVLNRSYGLAFDGAGNLYVANQGPLNSGKNFIERFDKNGVPTRFADTTLQPGSLSSPQGMAFDAAGNLYVANQGSNTIEQFTPSGIATVFASNALQPGSLNDPRGIAFDKAGNLYVANYLGNTIEKFNPLGVGTVFASNTLQPGFLNYPIGLAFDGAGNLFESDSNRYIQKFDSGGGVTTFATNNTGTLIQPYGLAFDSAGSLYAASGNQNNSIVAKFSSSGTGTRFDTGINTGLDAPTFLAFAPAPAPEPSSLAALTLGLCALGGQSLQAARRQARQGCTLERREASAHEHSHDEDTRWDSSVLADRAQKRAQK